MSRFPFAAALLAALLAVSVTACGDGSDKDAKPHRSTTTSSSSTSTSTSTTSTTLSEANGSTTTSTAPANPTESVGTCGNQTDAIVAAIGGSDMAGLNTRQGQFTVKSCRIAASSPIWAAANVVPNPGVVLDQASVLLQRIGALWNVMQVGTSRVGCDDAPMDVLTELHLPC